LKGSERWASRTSKHVPSSAEVNPEEVSLIDSGACGAFVYGLEDELLEVCLLQYFHVQIVLHSCMHCPLI
jgi:hypothetical protein